jgi:hypothetical protein
MTHPWEDPNLMPLYHVQLETRDLIVSYEIATPDFDYVEIATAHLRERLGEPHAPIHYGGGGSIGYHPIGDGLPLIIEWKVTTGSLDTMEQDDG